MTKNEIKALNDARKQGDTWICENCERAHPGYKPYCCCTAKTKRPDVK